MNIRTFFKIYYKHRLKKVNFFLKIHEKYFFTKKNEVTIIQKK